MSDVWNNLKSGEGRRVDAEGKFDFFWVILEKDSAALFLRLPDNFDDTISTPNFKSLEVQFRQLTHKALVVRLLDNTQKDIFLTLCKDVVAAAEKGQDLIDAVNRALRQTRRWIFLLRSGGQRGLTIEEQRGLVGEMNFLCNLSDRLGPAAAIEAWKGPEGSSKDFEFPELCIEVKAHRGAAKPHIRISSEDQLADVEGAIVYLQVYDVDSAVLPEGQTLHELVRMTMSRFEHDQHIFERFQDLLDAAGYNEEDDYSERRWIIGVSRTYRVENDFPRISGSLPVGVANVGYTIALSACEPFKVQDIEFSKVAGVI
jgi:hypothetical protein